MVSPSLVVEALASYSDPQGLRSSLGPSELENAVSVFIPSKLKVMPQTVDELESSVIADNLTSFFLLESNLYQ